MAVTDYQLHAYVDGQLPPLERDRVTCAVVDSEELAARVSAVHELKQLLRFVYGPDLVSMTEGPG
jgi:anti-sigma factor RsiW